MIYSSRGKTFSRFNHLEKYLYSLAPQQEAFAPQQEDFTCSFFEPQQPRGPHKPHDARPIGAAETTATASSDLTLLERELIDMTIAYKNLITDSSNKTSLIISSRYKA